MAKTVRGTVHGKTIELGEDLGVADGEQVEVEIRTKAATTKAKKLPGPPPGWKAESKETVAGALADLCTEEEDRLLDAIQQDRKRERRREIAE